MGKRSAVERFLGWRRAGVPLCVAGAAAFFAMGRVFAEETMAPPSETTNVESKTAVRGDKGASFIGKDGVATLTNVPDEYRGNGDYTEEVIHFDPIVVPGRLKTRQFSGDVRTLVRHYARQYGLEESLVYAVIRAESNFDPNAVSTAGARGLMQLMPGTAEDMGLSDPYDPAQNIAGGTQYLSKLLRIFGNNLDLALAAYNAGPEVVKAHKGIPPYKETQQYVRTVRRFYAEYARGGGEPVLVNSAKPSLAYLPRLEGRYYRVEFHSGLTQHAEKVYKKGSYYYLEFDLRTYRISEDKVKRVVKPA